MRLIVSSCALLLSSLNACAPTEPPGDLSITLELSREDVALTEVWLKAKVTDFAEPRSVTLTRDGQSILTVQIVGSDTILHDAGLVPNHAYSYGLLRVKDGWIVDRSTSISVQTLDTTSHNFLWKVDTIGVYTSKLRGVTIVAPGEAWAVGEYYLNDSSGKVESIPHNAMHWSGGVWNPVRIQFRVCPSTDLGTPDIMAVLSITSGDIWFTEGGNFVHQNGNSVDRVCLPAGVVPGALNFLWGASPVSIACVGNLGTIVRFNGLTWVTVPSPTNVDLRDVWGDAKTGRMWASGYLPNYGESVLLKNGDGQWEQIAHAPPWGVYQDLFMSIWFSGRDSVYVVGNQGVFRQSAEPSGGHRRIPLDLKALPHRIRGDAKNNIVIVGEQGMVWHFNGATWRRFDELTNPADVLYDVAVADDQIIAVGHRYYNGIENYAVIYHGRR